MSTAHNRARTALFLSVLVTVAVHHTVWGRQLGWPLVLLSTVAHELGHGLTALLVGGDFVGLSINSDASGVAMTRSSGRLARAAISAGGLLGPPAVAAMLFRSATSDRWARAATMCCAVVCVGILVFVRVNIFGMAMLLGLASALAWIGVKRSHWDCQLGLVFLGTQLALSTWSRSDYLFTPVARTANGTMPSDVAQMAQALWLPYWVWGGLCFLCSLATLWYGIAPYWRGDRVRSKQP